MKKEDYEFERLLSPNISEFCMTDLESFLIGKEEKLKTLEGLVKITESYLNTIPHEIKEELEDVTMDMLVRKYYNELPLKEAEFFINYLQDIIDIEKEKVNYIITPYDLNDLIDIPFQTQEEAKKFISAYGSPGTLFELQEDELFEIDCF